MSSKSQKGTQAVLITTSVMLGRSVGSFALLLAATAGISTAVPNSSTTTNSNKLQCWTNPRQVSHFHCSQAMRKACKVPVTWETPSTTVYITEKYEGCEASLILPYDHPCDLAVLQRILDTCIPRVTWFWQQGRGGSWNVQSDPSGSMPDVIVQSDEDQAAYALYARESYSRARPHKTVVAQYFM